MNKNQPVRILVILQLPTEYLQKIKQYFECSGFDADIYKTEICSELILNCIELYDAVIIDESYAFGAKILNQAKKLKAIGVLGTANNIDVEAATENNIIVEECTTEVVDVKSAEAMACHFCWLYNTHKTTLKYIPQPKRVQYVQEQNNRIIKTVFKKEGPKSEEKPGIEGKGDQKVGKRGWSKKKKAVVGVGAAVAVVSGIAAIPFLAGFSAGGVVAGSIAAGIQATIGNVAVGSLFAGLQTLAATTVIGTAAPAAAAAAGAATATGAALLMDKDKKKDP